jgi:hypothetical protein
LGREGKSADAGEQIEMSFFLVSNANSRLLIRVGCLSDVFVLLCVFIFRLPPSIACMASPVGSPQKTPVGSCR